MKQALVTEEGKQEAEKGSNQKSDINQWLVFAIIAFSLLMMTIDSTIVATALHTIQEDLDTSVSWVGWTLTAYSFGFVLMLPLSAKLSTRFGHRRIFVASVSVFTIASVFCGLSNNIYLLILMRIVQAIGGAGITPSATGLIVDHFGKSRAQFLGLFGSIFSVGALVGPIFGGFFVTYWSWPWIFFINFPLGVAVLILSFQYIPEDGPVSTRQEKMDFVGLMLMGTAILSAMYAATYLAEAEHTAFSSIFIGLAVLSVISFTLLSRHLKRVEAPFIQPRFIFGKGFGAVNLFNIIHSGMAIGALSLVPLYAINRYEISELHSGTLLVAEGLASVVLSAIMSMYINRTGYRTPLYVGGGIMVSGIGLLALEPQLGLSPFLWLMGSTFLVGIGFGIMSPAGRNAGISLAPEHSSNIAAVRSLGLQMGEITTISGTTAIIAGSQNASFTQAAIYASLAAFFLIALSIVPNIPEQKGAW